MMSKKDKLSQSEMQIMEYMWQKSCQLCIQDFLIQFKNTRWKRTTIRTFIKRLIDKGFIIVHKDGHNYYYEAAITKFEYTQTVINESLNTFYGHSIEGIIATFCGVDIDSKNMDKIRNFLTDLEKSNEQK